MLPWSRKMFPGTNLQDLNLDWILRKIAALRGGSTGQYLYKKSDQDFDFGWKTGGGGGGGTSDYLDLDNKPSINNVELTGNKTAAQLGLATPSDIPTVPVQSVNGKTGAVVLGASDVGAGTYTKPSTGIPKSDLASGVQTSLNKADTALQSVPSAYRTAAAQDAIDATQDADIETRAQAGEVGIVITGARPSMAAAAGQYVIVRNSTISGITDGLYTANAALSPSTDVTAANLSPVNIGGFNDLLGKTYTRTIDGITWNVIEIAGGTVIQSANLNSLSIPVTTSSSGGYISEVNTVTMPVSLAFGIFSGVGAQVTFFTNATVSGNTANFRLASITSRTVIGPYVMVIGHK